MQSPNPKTDHASRVRALGRTRIAFVLILSVVVFALPATVHVLNLLKVHGFPFGYFVTAHAVPVLCAVLVWVVVWRQSAATKPNRIIAMPGSALLSGLSFSIASLGMPLACVLTAAAFHQGYDGLVLGLGWTAGTAVLAVWTAPMFIDYRVRSLVGLLGQALQSPSVGFVAVVVTAVVSGGLLVAVFAEFADIGANVLGFRRPDVLFAAAGVVAVVAVLVPLTWLRKIFLAFALVMILALVVIVIWIGISQSGGIIPQFGYGSALEAIADLEHQALISGAADPVTFKVHARPEVHFSRMNFAVLTLCLMLGTAVMPHILTAAMVLSDAGRVRTAWKVEAGFWPGAYAVTIVVLLVVTVPAIAAVAKLVVFRDVVGQQISDLPTWLFATPWKVSVAEICGHATTDVATVIAACGAQLDQTGMLRIDDVAVSGGQVVLMVLAATKAPIWLWCVYALGACAAFASLAVMLGLSLKIALEDCIALRQNEMQKAAGTANVLISVAVLIALAAYLALITKVPANEMVVGSFSLAAGAFFPTVLVATWWPRVKPTVVMTGLVAGLIGGLLYLLGTLLAPVVFFHLTMPLSNATNYAIEDYFELLALWRSAGPETSSTAWTVLTEHCRPLANWWGLRPSAAGLIGMIFAGVAMLVAMAFGREHRLTKKD